MTGCTRMRYKRMDTGLVSSLGLDRCARSARAHRLTRVSLSVPLALSSLLYRRSLAVANARALSRPVGPARPHRSVTERVVDMRRPRHERPRAGF